jgi:transcriptional regulator with XRE-family HTH domain
VTRSYVTNLRKGRIDNPGYAKLAAMAKAMGFPPEVWFEDSLGEGRSIGQAEVSYGVAARLEHLFEVVRNPKTGEPYTNAEVARMRLSDLSEKDVKRIRTYAIGDPTVGQVAALAGVFGVEPSYLLDGGEPSLLRVKLFTMRGNVEILVFYKARKVLEQPSAAHSLLEGIPFFSLTELLGRVLVKRPPVVQVLRRVDTAIVPPGHDLVAFVDHPGVSSGTFVGRFRGIALK